MEKETQNPDHLRTILNSIADGVFTVDLDWCVTSFNRAAEQITGVPGNEAIGRKCYEVFHASVCEKACVLKQTMKTGKPIVNRGIYIINNEGKRIPITISTALLKDAEGNVIGGVETFRDLSIVEELRRELEHRYTFQDIISKSPAFQRIFEILPAIAQSDSTVLIEGESGTGKELLARAVHNLSMRSNQPLITVNCGALPESLLESELFGYRAGAFTNAIRDKPGRFALADGGTIFLDEIGDLSPAMQVKLLRVLQEKCIEPLGGTRSEAVDVRVITATNRKLSKLVDDGHFRMDLYYRINVIRIEMPPLHERREDIPLLIDHFIGRFNKLKGKLISGVSPNVLSLLMNYNYPGNVRELENIIEHAFVLCNTNIIQVNHLPPEHRPQDVVEDRVELDKPLKELEVDFILSALKRNNWNRKKTADELGMHKTTLFRKIRKLGIVLPETDGRNRSR